MATNTKAWKPNLETIRRRSKDVLSTSRVACESGEFQHVTGHVFLEQEFLLRYVAQLEAKLVEADIELPRPGRGKAAVAELPPEPEALDDEADPDEAEPEGE